MIVTYIQTDLGKEFIQEAKISVNKTFIDWFADMFISASLKFATKLTSI